jgi:hypothetical protein
MGTMALWGVTACCLVGPAAVAEDCISGVCVGPATQPSTQVTLQPAAQTATPPLQLGKFRRRPVAPGKAARAVKTDDRQYAKVKQRPHHKSKPSHQVAAEAPVFLPVVVSPDAAAALAMQATAAHAAATVQVVDAAELNDIDRAAIAVPAPDVPATETPAADAPATNDGPLVAQRVATRSITLPATAPAPVATTNGRSVAAEVPQPPTASTAPSAASPPAAAQSGVSFWIGRVAMWLTDSFVALFAAVRALFG